MQEKYGILSDTDIEKLIMLSVDLNVSSSLFLRTIVAY